MNALNKLMMGVGASLLMTASVQAAQDIELNEVSADGVGESIGTVTVEDTDYGLLLTPDVSNLDPGIHGFHVHQNASCKPAEKNGEMTAAAAAGGHFDPENTQTHQGPYGDGHLGDLPVLIVDDQGNATLPVLAPRLEVSDLAGHALMVHQGGDNYTNEPKLGGGGPRVACGAIEQ